MWGFFSIKVFNTKKRRLLFLQKTVKSTKGEKFSFRD